MPKPASAMMKRPVLLPVIHFSPSLSFSPPPRLACFLGSPASQFSTTSPVSPCCRLMTDQGIRQGRRDLCSSRGPGLGTRHNAVYITTHLPGLQLFLSWSNRNGALLYGRGKSDRTVLKCPKAVEREKSWTHSHNLKLSSSELYTVRLSDCPT